MTFFYTPTTPERMADPFLEPCRQRRRQIATTYGLTTFEDIEPGRLPDKYERGRRLALEHNGQAEERNFMLIIEDDEEPPLDFPAEAMRVHDVTGAGVVTCMKPLRPEATKAGRIVWAPLKWNMGTCPSGVYGCVSVTEMRPDPDKDVERLEAATLCSPLFLDLDQVNFPFRPAHPDQPQSWDLGLSYELDSRHIPVYCIMHMVTAHRCIVRREVYP